jgi:D-amino-acid dehydrogenase
MRVAVVGAGIVGLACAAYLQRDGHEVTIVEREGPGEGTSKGNAGAVSPGSCAPLAMPGVFRKIPGWLLDREGPLTIRPAYFPRALPWLLRFTASAAPARVERIADALRALHKPTFDCYAPLVKDAGCEDLVRRTGTMFAFRSAAALRGSEREWKLRRERGVELRPVSGGELREIEPAIAAAFTHGMYLPTHGYVAEPYRLSLALAKHFQASGGRIERARVTRLVPSGDSVTIEYEGGRLEADYAVLAAGVRSGELLAPLGIRLPLETQRGYHVTLSDPGFTPRLPVSVSEGKFYATPMEGGLRVAGTVEFAGLDAPPDYRRARRLLAQVQQLYPQVRLQAFTEWMGHRPCMPDSLPVVGPAPRHPRLMLAFGHGHNGMTSGPVTGRLVADLIAGRAPIIDPAPYAATRF